MFSNKGSIMYNKVQNTNYFKRMLIKYLTKRLGYEPKVRVMRSQSKTYETNERDKVICRLFSDNIVFTILAPLSEVMKVKSITPNYPDIVVQVGEGLAKQHEKEVKSINPAMTPERLRMKVTTDLAILGSLKAFQKVCLTKKRKISTSDKPVTNPEVKEALVFLLNELTSGLEFEINKVIKSLQANGVGIDKENTKPTLQ
nr:MAG TPA: hypothetical protein [Caudoviricetes sp.]